MASTTSIIKGGFSCGNTLSSFRARPRRMVVRAEAVNPDIRKDEEKVVNSLNLLLLTADRDNAQSGMGQSTVF
ncbi:hypothetical protein P3S68_028290 [Capsicum galapagoense]